MELKHYLEYLQNTIVNKWDVLAMKDLDGPQGSQSSSRMRACTFAFLQSGSSSVTQSAAWIKGTDENDVIVSHFTVKSTRRRVVNVCRCLVIA